MFRTLQKAKDRLGTEAKSRIVEYIRSQQINNGMFTNRNQLAVDPYYSVFGFMLTSIFGIKINTHIAIDQHNKYEIDPYNLTSFSSYIRTSHLIAVNINKLRATWNPKVKGKLSFNSFPNGDPTSPYSQFLLWCLKEDLKYKISDKLKILQSLDNYRTTKGGFSNIKGENSISTNATAAAMLLKGQIKGYKTDNDVYTLREMQEDMGGFKASEVAPTPDLLSTATALFALSCYKLAPRVNATNFVEAHWNDNGGFAGTIADENTDIEYTFYALLALGT
jgi:prenyltransferase beta subunit